MSRRLNSPELRPFLQRVWIVRAFQHEDRIAAPLQWRKELFWAKGLRPGP